MRAKQIMAAVGLSALFIVVYGACNAITAVRSDVGTLYFQWERYIPFVPILIIPYMSIDLFFIGAPFTCRTTGELKLYVRRVVAGILIAGACFLLVPLKYVGERPVPDGVLRPIFVFLHGFDQPYNLLPSLHIILRCVLVAQYVRWLHGGWRGAAHVWFFLIGLSTLLVGQHHVADVVAGFVAAAAVFFLVRDDRCGSTLTSNPAVGIYYLAGCGVLSVAAWYAGVWGLPIAWAALTAGIVGLAYFRFGSALTAKRDGVIPLSARIVLGPWLLGQWLSLQYYKRQTDPWNELTPNVWIGRLLNASEAREARRLGVTAVIDMTCEFDEAAPFRNGRYLNLSTLDLTAPVVKDIDRAVAFIEKNTPPVTQGVVYVHCKIGYSRTVAVAGAHLLKTGRAASVAQAVEMIRAVRPRVVIRPEIRAVLEQYSAAQAAERIPAMRETSGA